MATHEGKEGTVRIGAVTIAEIVEFSIDHEITPVDDTSLSDTAETHIAGSGRQKWSGTIKCHWDELDTTGQEAMVIGFSGTFNLCPEGFATGDKYLTGLASVTRIGVAIPLNGVTSREFTIQGNGPLAWATAP